MKYQRLLLFLLSCIIFSCSNNQKKVPAKTTTSSTVTHSSVSQNPVNIHKDTLQFIHFDGNLDYWYAFFLTAKKDTLRLVTDTTFTSGQLDRLFEVRWRPDTLSEAGDNERKYADNRMIGFREIKGAPFERVITENKVLEDIKNLVEVKEGADRVWVAGRPDMEKPYFAVETATAAEDNISRLFSFRVYIFPKYEIKILDTSNDKEMTLAEWRTMNK